MRPSVPIQIIAKLPFGRKFALRLYNRVLMHVSPRREIETYFGAKISCDVRDMIQGTITHFGVWEPRLSRQFELMIKPGDTIVDVGANIGYYSLLFAKASGPSGSVIAIEALPKLATIVREHAERNKLENIRVVNVAASDLPGTVILYEAPSTNIGMTTMRKDRGFPAAASVDSLPLTDILSAAELAAVTLIKIDIEGAEIPVVRQILDNIDRFTANPAIAVEASIAENPEWSALFDRFCSLGYSAYDLHNEYDWMAMLDYQTRKPTPLASVPDDQTDILFIRGPLDTVNRSLQ